MLGLRNYDQVNGRIVKDLNQALRDGDVVTILTQEQDAQSSSSPRSSSLLPPPPPPEPINPALAPDPWSSPFGAESGDQGLQDPFWAPLDELTALGSELLALDAANDRSDDADEEEEEESIGFQDEDEDGFASPYDFYDYDYSWEEEQLNMGSRSSSGAGIMASVSVGLVVTPQEDSGLDELSFDQTTDRLAGDDKEETAI